MISENIKEQIIKLKNEKYSIKQIKNELNVNLYIIYKVLKEKQISLISKLNDENIREIINTYLSNNLNLQKTAKILENKYKKSTIVKYLKINKIYISSVNQLSKEEKLKKKSKTVINWKKEKRKLLIKYKGGKCEKCGYNKCIEALDFHHLDPSQKEFGLSSNSYSLEKMKKEADKCILVCANCHREIHYLK